MKKRVEAYRDGLLLYTEGEVLDTDRAVVEVLYESHDSAKRIYFAEIKGTTLCAHGDTIEDAIEDALCKGSTAKLSDEQKREYRNPEFKFSVALFRRITGACNAGINSWLDAAGLDRTVKMTLEQFKKVGPVEWVSKLQEAIDD